MSEPKRTKDTGDIPEIPGLNPDSTAFEEVGAGILRVTKLAASFEGRAGKVFGGVSQGLFGKALASVDEPLQRISKAKALPILASDNISSSAYATEEIMRVLVLAGALSLTLPISFMLVAVIVVVVASYSQVVRAYPTGGGSYQASRENLGTVAGLVTAGSLLVDYVLTVAVSVAAGVAAITSAVPALFDYRVFIALGAIVLLVIGNLRGIRETGNVFSAPTYIYIASIAGLIAYGLFRLVSGTLPTYSPPPELVPDATQALTLVLLVRAFSSGAVALTGVEAVSNGMRILKPPESRNAAFTMGLMAIIFTSIFLGLGFLTTHVGLIPDPEERETVISQFAHLIVGNGWYYQIVQASTALLLLLAANTAFVGFPRLSFVLAVDRFMPNQFVFRGRRLSLITGVVAVGALAAVLIVVFEGSVSSLIPLYTVGVFIAFTLSQAGMMLYWRRHKTKGWRAAFAMNGVGAIVTALVAIEVITVKFVFGAWIILVLIPVLALMMMAINRHYVLLGRQLKLDPSTPVQSSNQAHVVLVPVADLTKAVLRALFYARNMSSDVIAIHVADSIASTERLRERWDQYVKDIPLIILESPYRDWTGPLLHYIESISQHNPDAPVTVVVPEFIPSHWWENFLHSQSALRLKMTLLSKPNIVVVDIPYHIKT